MATTTPVLSLRRPDGPDMVRRTLDFNNNMDLLDALFHAATGHTHSASGTNGPTVVLNESQVVYDAAEAATNDTLTGASKLINNLNRIRYSISQVSGVAWGAAITESLNTHRLNTASAHGTTGFAAPTIALGSASVAGAATTLIRSDATIAAFDAIAPSTQAYSDSPDIGTAAFAARRDHKHGFPASGVPAFATPAVAFGAAAAAGAAGTVIRSDSTIAAFADGTGPAAVAVSAVVGVINFAARRDHQHAHSSLGSITNAHAFADMSGVITDAQHGSRTTASAHAAAQITNAASLIAVNTFTKQYAASAFSVAFSATPTFDWNNSNVQFFPMNGNVTSSTFNNPIDGGRYILFLTQDVTGSRTFAFPATFHWPGGTGPVLSGPNKVDMLGFIYRNGVYFSTAALDYVA